MSLLKDGIFLAQDSKRGKIFSESIVAEANSFVTPKTCFAARVFAIKP